MGRLLVASLHQAIADLLPGRLTFYESWLGPAGFRNGGVSLASINAVLSFLRREADSYEPVVAQAGAYASQWTIEQLPRIWKVLTRLLPSALGQRLALWLVLRMISRTAWHTTASVTRDGGRLRIRVKGSPFCAVRTSASTPLCGFYAATVRGLMAHLTRPVDVHITSCRGTGAAVCALAVEFRDDLARSPAAVPRASPRVDAGPVIAPSGDTQPVRAPDVAGDRVDASPPVDVGSVEARWMAIQPTLDDRLDRTPAAPSVATMPDRGHADRGGMPPSQPPPGAAADPDERLSSPGNGPTDSLHLELAWGAIDPQAEPAPPSQPAPHSSWTREAHEIEAAWSRI